MKIENQVVSLELSKRLKELGAPQKSYFFHALTRKGLTLRGGYTRRQRDQMDMVGVDMWSAFTVAELGELLQTFIDLEGTNRVFNCWKEPQGWQCAYCPHSGSGDYALQQADTEADARAAMLIYLLENKLITL